MVTMCQKTLLQYKMQVLSMLPVDQQSLDAVRSHPTNIISSRLDRESPSACCSSLPYNVQCIKLPNTSCTIVHPQRCMAPQSHCSSPTGLAHPTGQRCACGPVMHRYLCTRSLRFTWTHAGSMKYLLSTPKKPLIDGNLAHWQLTARHSAQFIINFLIPCILYPFCLH